MWYYIRSNKDFTQTTLVSKQSKIYVATFLLAKEDGLKSIAIFLDLSKAFDTLSHDLLLKKLEIYGIRGLSNKWFNSYISNRQLQVKCKTLSSNMTESSSKYQITYGTAQGSCLGPLLFNIFCNDLYLNINNCNLIIFADDTTLYASHWNSQYLNYLIQNDLKNISEWFKANSLSLNLDKTFMMEFDIRTDKSEIIIELDGKTIPKTDCIKFLGVTIESKLKWNEHIKNLLSKISVNKNLIGKAHNILSIHSKKSIYYAHIYSHLIYTNTIWSGNITYKQKRSIKKYKIIA